MKIELNKVYWYQGVGGCFFIRPINRKYNRTLVVTCFNLLDAIKLPILESFIDYGPYQEEGIVSNIWTVEDSFFKNSILISQEELPEERIRRINISNRFNNPVVYAKAVDEITLKREIYLNNILEYGEEE